MSHINYSFNIAVAKEYGVNEAIMVNNIVYWVIKNKANGKNCHDGRTWTFNSVRAYKLLFPFWTDSQIRTIFKNLIKRGVLVTGNYNKISYDRTLWYAFKSEEKFLGINEIDNSICQNHQMEKSDPSNRIDETNEPIPNINKINKTHLKNTYTEYETLWNNFASENNLSLLKRLTSKRKNHLKARIKADNNFKDNFIKCLDLIIQSDFLIGNNDRGWKVDFEWIIKNDDNYNKVLEGKYTNKQPLTEKKITDEEYKSTEF